MGLRILVQCMTGIGNVLMATPMIAELRRAYPDAQIDLLTTSGSAHLLSTNPDASRVFADVYERSHLRRDYWTMIRQIRGARYDACFLCITAVDYLYVARIALARIGTRVIHDYQFHSNNDLRSLCTHIIPFDQTRHDVESNLDMLRPFVSGPLHAGPLVLPVSDAERIAARALLEQQGWQEDRTVAFCPGSDLRWAAKRWPIENYARLGQELLANNHGLRIVVFCGPGEEKEYAYLQETLKDRRVTLVQSLDLLLYPAAIDLCNVVVSADSLPVHIAAARQRPLVGLYGPTDPRRTGPWMGPAAILQAECDFAPYYRIPYPPDPSQFGPCMELISVERVLEAVATQLEGPASRARS